MPTMGRKPTVNINLPPRMRSRTQRSGKVFYYYDAGGKPRKEIPLGSDYILAVRKWSDLHKSELSISHQPTLKDVWDKFVIERLYNLSAATQKDYQKCIKKILEFFNEPPAPLAEITPTHIRKFLDWRGKEAKVRANHERRLVNLLWNCAREWGYTTLANPCTGIDGFKEPGRKVYIEDDVKKAVYECACQPLKDALDIAYLTIQRPGDVAKMYETDIQNGRLFVEQGKTGKRLKINIIGQLKQVIDRILQRKAAFKVRSLALIVDEYGKPLSQRAIWQRFDKARTQAALDYPKLKEKIEQYQLRDLRAKGATDKAIRTNDMRAAQKLLAHSDLTMTEHYVRDLVGDEVDPTE
jgi:site-specific recombinase XerC